MAQNWLKKLMGIGLFCATLGSITMFIVNYLVYFQNISYAAAVILIGISFILFIISAELLRQAKTHTT